MDFKKHLHNKIIDFLTVFILVDEIKTKVRKFFKYYPPAPIWITYPLNKGKHSFWGNIKVWHKDTSVGAFTSISWNVELGTTHHPTSWLSTHVFQYAQPSHLKTNLIIPKENLKKFKGNIPVTVGNDVWIGCNAIVLDGVKIGDGAIVGAGAVVTKDVPPYAIVGGVPAKVLKYRFEENIIDLLELRWWDLKDDIIQNLPFDDVNNCVGILKKFREEGKLIYEK